MATYDTSLGHVQHPLNQMRRFKQHQTEVTPMHNFICVLSRMIPRKVSARRQTCFAKIRVFYWKYRTVTSLCRHFKSAALIDRYFGKQGMLTSRTATVDHGLTKAILAFEMRLRVGTSHRALKSDPLRSMHSRTLKHIV
ncbi:hypothetical protein FOQG_19150 [Fusarium oxysporum f. sp. raphani 54005]|uniref:Uncharacterized protein n=1 Tax=Fusarium oxysporum f. sp. raphani 54005 TaxID=1089458 RepID=X0BZX5_FUSOX|nr:hypothetical protein FOQG_19150 [Fusarium oxysporum f. sp. raphani 54005]